jgi:hypothetical protein
MKAMVHAKTTLEKTKPLINKISKNDFLNAEKDKPSSAKGAHKRDKLRHLLITKYMKLFNITGENKLINEEVNQFLKKNLVNDSDLKLLEKKLGVLLGKTIDRTKSQPVMTNINMSQNKSLCDFDSKEVSLPPIDKKAAGSMSMMDDEEDFEERKSKIVPKHGDEWIKIINHNKKVFESEKQNKIIKEHEKKAKTKNELDHQLEEKHKKVEIAEREEVDYFKFVLKDVSDYKKSEKDKQDEMKRKIMLEKQIRDKQLREEKSRKKISSEKELENDKKLLQRQLDLIEQEKRSIQEKKMREKAAYVQLLKDNEEYKKVVEKRKQEDRESDIRAIEEYSRILDKQEKARSDYFKRCENRQSDFMTKMAQNVVKINDDKLAKEDENITRYLNEKDRQNKFEEERRRKRIQDQNMETRKMLDFQMEIKKKENDYDRDLGRKYAQYMQNDSKNFEDQERQKMIKVKLNVS